MFRFLVALARSVVFGGWIIPLWLCGDTLLVWKQGVVSGRIDSFPHLAFARTMLGTAMIWGCLAILIFSICNKCNKKVDENGGS